MINDVGHTAIQLDPNHVFGYYPSSSSGHGYGSGDLMSSKGAPSIVTRSIFESEYSRQGYTAYTLNITSHQLSSIQSYLSNIMANPGTYSLFMNNCTSVVISALENAGVDLRTTASTPISPAITPPSALGWDLSHLTYMPGLVIGIQHYGGN